MEWYDWLLVAVIILGFIVRTVGRGIRIRANLKYKDNPVKRMPQVRRGTIIVWIGIGLMLLVAIILAIILLMQDNWQ